MDFQLLQHPLAVAILASLAVAMEADWTAFKSFKSFREAASYEWSVAAWRLTKGVVIGIAAWLTGSGVVTLVSQAS